MSYQINMTIPNSEWVTPSEFPDLSQEDEIAIDLETRDENMKNSWKLVGLEEMER
jgi:hypothetical protein